MGQLDNDAFTSAISEMASEFHMLGCVTAVKDGLLISCNACPEIAYQFYRGILQNATGSFSLVSHHMAVVAKEEFDCFTVTGINALTSKNATA